ncbi:MAG TPA: tetratricopeptide repeat protein [Myxococcota bacterium]|nr:tetratricopeptide repeat protein [Myxococcota bacterium]
MADDDPVETDIAAGHMLFDAGMHDKAIEHFRALVGKLPRDARTHFALASALDSADREPEAIPVYAEAIRLRPTGELLARAYLGLGSSLTHMGRDAEALEVFSQGSRRFPEHGPLRAFLALASARTGKPREAVLELVEDLLTHHDMGPYAETLRRQLAELRKAPRR